VPRDFESKADLRLIAVKEIRCLSGSAGRFRRTSSVRPSCREPVLRRLGTVRMAALRPQWDERGSARRSDRQHQEGARSRSAPGARGSCARSKAMASTVDAPARPVRRVITTPASV
jgi:hypothetical protein